MSGIIAKQPNGLYCRISTIIDAPTHSNMTKQDYIDLCVERAKREAEDVLENYCYDFESALTYINYGDDANMTNEEYKQFVVYCNTKVE